MTDTELSAIRARAEFIHSKPHNGFVDSLKRIENSAKDIPALLAHIDHLEEALARATAQNAATLAEHTVNFIQGLADAVAGDDGKTIISMRFSCLYCHKVMGGTEEARECV